MQSATDSKVYYEVYQEWDILREAIDVEEQKIGKVTVDVEMSSFPVQLQEARIRMRYTILELATKCNVSPKSMAMYENGSELPTDDVMTEIRKVLGI